jgi:hypothetical protein
MVRKKPCSICRKWFQPDARVGTRQRACSRECSDELRRRTQAEWRRQNPEYFKARRLKERSRRARAAEEAAQEVREALRTGREPPAVEERAEAPAVVRMRGELRRLPWEAVQSEIGVEATDFIAVVATLLVRLMQSEIRKQVVENKREPPRLQGSATQT